MGTVIKKTADWETFIQLKAVGKLLRSRSLTATDKYFQVGTRDFIVRFLSDHVPPGKYMVSFSGEITAFLVDNPKGQSTILPEIPADSQGWFIDSVICGYVGMLQEDVMRIANVPMSIQCAEVVYAVYKGQNVSIMHRGPGNPVFIMAKGMIMALMPKVQKVDKLISGLPVTDRDALKRLAETRGTSVNRLILGAITRLLACMVLVVLIGCTDVPTTPADTPVQAPTPVTFDWHEPTPIPWKTRDRRLLQKVWRRVDPWAAPTVEGEG